MSKIAAAFVLFIFILSCSTKSNQESSIDNIVVVSFKYPIITSVPMECGMLPNSAKEGNEGVPEGLEQFIDTILKDDRLLKMIEKRISLLEVDTNIKYPGNTHIQCVINYKDESSDLLCLETFGTIYFKNKAMLEDDTLSYLIKKNVGFYKYNEDMLDLFPEFKFFEK